MTHLLYANTKWDFSANSTSIITRHPVDSFREGDSSCTIVQPWENPWPDLSCSLRLKITIRWQSPCIEQDKIRSRKRDRITSHPSRPKTNDLKVNYLEYQGSLLVGTKLCDTRRNNLPNSEKVYWMHLD